jgi:multiple sugar transport system substrate-binding protein
MTTQKGIFMKYAVLLVTFLVTFAFAQTEIVVWAPSEDNCNPEAEAGIIACQVDDFNAMQSDVVVKLETGPIDTWTDFINAGALAGDLPDIIYVDGPTLANFAWAGYLAPLDGFMSEELEADFLGSILEQGLYNGQTYALGAFDSGLGIWGNRALLEAAGVRIPTSVEDAWTREEFQEVLAALQEVEGVEYAMDMKMNYGQGEWFTYGFAPIVQSMGGDLINRTDYQSAEGVLNGPEAVEAMTMFQSWFNDGYVNATPAGDTDFDEGKSAISWVGHWMYTRYKEALGDNLILLPLPKFGETSATGTGSFAWTITSQSANPEAAWTFLEYVLSPEQIVRMTNVAGAVPSRKSALELSDLYREGGELALYPSQLDSVGVPRPVTPAYPTITLAFAEAVNNIANGADVQEELDAAVEAIDQDITDNGGYAPQ